MIHTIGRRGIALTKTYEGLKLRAYRDSKGIPTIGYGTTRGVKMGMTITAAVAEAWLRRDMSAAEEVINEKVKVDLNANQFDALCAFVYNVGIGAFEGSELLKLINQNRLNEAANEFTKWCHAGDRVIPGLVNRRAGERALWLLPPQAA